jgi:biotin transport system substrate-specific component
LKKQQTSLNIILVEDGTNMNHVAKNISLKMILYKAYEHKFVWILSFTLLTVISAQVAVPVKPVPFTLQTMAVLLSGAFLGARRGAYSQLVYLFLGVIGLPVFAAVPNGAMGVARLFGPTGGYLLAFPIAAFITGYIIEKNKSYFAVVSAMLLSNIVILVVGVLFLYSFYLRDFQAAVESGAAVFSMWMIIKIIAASTIYYGIRKRKTE